MSIVISLVFLALIYSIAAIIKVVASKSGGVDAKPVIGEVFPQIEPLKPADEYYMPTPQFKENGLPKACVTPPVMRREEGARSLVRTNVQQVADGEVGKHEKIVIKGKSDARKAFIYSEIFNRKY